MIALHTITPPRPQELLNHRTYWIRLIACESDGMGGANYTYLLDPNDHENMHMPRGPVQGPFFFHRTRGLSADFIRSFQRRIRDDGYMMRELSGSSLNRGETIG